MSLESQVFYSFFFHANEQVKKKYFSFSCNDFNTATFYRKIISKISMNMTDTPYTSSFNTLRADNKACQDFEMVTGVSPENLDLRSLERWDLEMISRNYKPATRRQRLSLVMKRKPSVDFPLPEREQPTQHYLLKEQIAQLFSALPKNLTGHLDFLMLSLFLLTGRRNSQIRKLRWDQLIQNDDLLFIEKEVK